MPKAFTPQEREIIIQRLMEVGYQQFSTIGLKKTSVEELARAAGISKAAFYLFFPSKESLFMDVVEQAEVKFRRVILDTLAQPGSSPRARLMHLFETAFTHWKQEPILQFFTNAEYTLLLARIPSEKVLEHTRSDAEFIVQLINSCQEAGIAITANPEEIGPLMYVLFFASMHENDLGNGILSGAIHRTVELIAAFCLGEVTLLEQH